MNLWLPFQALDCKQPQRVAYFLRALMTGHHHSLLLAPLSVDSLETGSDACAVPAQYRHRYLLSSEFKV